MKQLKQFTATALALSLCFSLVSCSSGDGGGTGSTGETPSTSTTDTPSTSTTDTPSSTPSDADTSQDSGDSADSGSEVSYESYLQDLNDFAQNFMSLQEPFAAAATAFSTDYENPEIVQNYVDMLKEMNEKFGEIEQVTPTEDMAETHQNFVNSCAALTATMDSMIAVLEDDFVNAGQEGLDAYNTLFTGDYQTTYSEFATTLFAVADEIQANMG